MNAREHPTYPLQSEQRAAIIAEARTQADVKRIQQQFADRRNREHPGWRQQYEADVREWLRHQGKIRLRA